MEPFKPDLIWFILQSATFIMFGFFASMGAALFHGLMGLMHRGSAQ